MQKALKLSMLFMFVLITVFACRARLSSSNMNKVQLGMTKEQVTNIMGKKYRIAEKRKERSNEIEVLSYRDRIHEDEFYLFRFKNNKLEKWYRELSPKLETKEN